MRSRWVVASAGVVAVLAMPIATWWIVGDQSTTENLPDYIVEPPAVSADTALAFGLVATVLLVASVATLLGASHARRLDRSWWGVLLPLLGAGFVVGYSVRVVTAGVIGANIGGGMAIMFGGPLVVGLIGWAAFRAFLRSRRSHSQPVGS